MIKKEKVEFCSSSRSFWTAPYPKQIIPYPGKSPVSGLARLHMTQPWFRKSSRPILLNMRTMTGDGGAGDADSLAGPRGGHTRLHECGPLQIRHARQGHTRQAGDTQTPPPPFHTGFFYSIPQVLKPFLNRTCLALTPDQISPFSLCQRKISSLIFRCKV